MSTFLRLFNGARECAVPCRWRVHLAAILASWTGGL